MIDNKYKWVARDSDNLAHCFCVKPKKHRELWYGDGYQLCITDEFICDFPSVKWEDDEPTSLDEIRNYKE